MADALTLEQAATLDVAMDDDTSTPEQLPVAYESEPDADLVPAETFGGATDPVEDFRQVTVDEGDAGDRLTLEQAAKIEITGEPAVKDERPVAVVDGQALTLQNLVDVFIAAKNTAWHVGRINQEYERLIGSADSIVGASWKLAELVSDRAPPPPSPALAQINPNAYVIQRAWHEAVDQFISAALQPGGEAQQAAIHLMYQRHNELLHLEAANLLEHLPECRDPAARNEFFEGVKTVASVCGFTEAELEQVVDHRLFRLAKLAIAGLEAQEPTQPKTKQKPRRRRRQRSDAMERLSRTGSFQDAMKVDFD